MAFLSQAPPLGGLLPPHGAFQEHAAHPPEWSEELSSKGSSGTCIPDGVFHIPLPCFHGAHTGSDSKRPDHRHPAMPAAPMCGRPRADDEGPPAIPRALSVCVPAASAPVG